MGARPDRLAYWFADLAWVGGRVAERVTMAVADGQITELTCDSEPPPGATRLRGLTIPGLANAHSHALHRALRGRTQVGAKDFWAWRQLMYGLVDRLDPESYYELARATYAEMALAGITAVGEFHYLHHAEEGRHYANPNAMGEALLAAAADAGIRITLIDTCYLQAAVGGGPLQAPQRRFSDGDAEAWAARVEELSETPQRGSPPPSTASERWTSTPFEPSERGQTGEASRCMYISPNRRVRMRSASLPREMTPTALLGRRRRAWRETTAVHGHT